MRRTLDPTNLNLVVNHPEVRPWLKGEGELDVSHIVSDPANFTFEVEGGGFICINRGNCAYEVHSQFVPEARRYTLRTMYAAIEYMFLRTDCIALLSHFPDGNAAAEALGRKAGFKPFARLDEGPFAPCDLKRINMCDWIADRAEFEADGERFHAALEQAKLAAGSTLPVHPHDPAHERFVGAAVRMSECGNVAKGVATYNAWASCNGYAPITLVSAVPPVVDVVDGIVSFDGSNALQILSCR